MSFLINAMEKGGRCLAATLTSALVAFAAVSPASASSFQVNPVNIELSAGRSSTSVSIRNNNSDPVTIRVVTMKWTQVNGQDVYTQAREVIASPPIFTIKPGATQLVRFGLRSRTPGAAYRVILEEVPGAKPEGTGIQVALRLNLPLYILDDKGEANVTWRATRDTNGELVLEGRNDGTRHAQVTEISTVDAAGNKILLSKQMGVILPRSSRQWTVSGKNIAPSSSLPIRVRSGGIEMTTNAVIEAR